MYKTVPNTIIEKIPPTIPEKEITIPKTDQLIETSIPYNLDLCTEKDILEGKCKGKISSENIKKIFDQLKQTISSDSNEIIETENVVFQLSTLEEQKNNNNPNVSSIDLGECEQLIKNQEGLSENDNLIVLKTDIKNEDLSLTYVQYEIYNPISLELISLDICSDIPISISIPIALNENTKSIYDSLCQSGYNLFNLNDSFYNDICTTYTTKDGTDLTLADRKNLIYDTNSNISMCQNGCTFEFFNTRTNKAKCDCSIQKEETITDVSKIKFDKKELADSFFNTLKNSNFLVLKCYKLVFSKKGQINNIGSYMMSIIDFLFIFLMFVYIINGNKKLDFYIQSILKLKLNHSSNNRVIYFKNLENGNNNKRIETFIKPYKKSNKVKIIRKKKLKINKKRKKKYMKKPIQTGNINTNYPPKKRVNFIILNNCKKSKDILLTLPEKFQAKSRSKNNLLKIKKKFYDSGNQKNNTNMNKISKATTEQSSKLLAIKKNHKKYNKGQQSSKTLSTKNNKISYIYKENNFNDEELNSLEYEIALEFDKRTYFQYYISLLKKKQLILFAFYPAEDYNLIVVKISLLMLSFSLFFTINGFFFSDATMNKINEDKGVYNIIFQIPQILYSTVISAIINTILKRLSLSEKQILMIKLEKDFILAQKKSISIKKCLKIKLTCFFILSLTLMIFFWYFISCFCAVYKNTQIILINDSLISFALSMIYPFGLYLLPGLFRTPALKAPLKDKKCLYKASNLIAII